MITNVIIEDDPAFVDPVMPHLIGGTIQYNGAWPLQDVDGYFRRAAQLHPKAHYHPRRKGYASFGRIAFGIGEMLACSLLWLPQKPGIVQLRAWTWTAGRTNQNYENLSFRAPKAVTVPNDLTARLLRVHDIDLILAIQDGKADVDFINARTGLSLRERKTPPRKAA